MSTNSVVPSAAAAPPVAAPAAAPAPVSTPAVPAAAPSAPAATPAAAPSTSVSQPPDPKNFTGDQFAEYRAAKAKYAAEHPDGEEAAKPADAVAAPGDAVADPAKVEEPAKADAAAPDFEAGGDPLEEHTSITPQALSEMLGTNKALQDALAADPKAKGALFKMARENAELKEFADIFPDADSGRFAAKTANEYVALRTKFETAQTPADMNGAFESFVDQFKIVDADGKPVLENGVPKLAADYYAFADTFKGRLFDGAMAEIAERLAANQYATPEAREADENRKLAYEFLKQDTGEIQTGPDLSALPPEVRAQIEKREADLKAREEALNGKQTGQSAQEQAAAKAAHYQAFNKEIGGRIKGVFDSTLKPLREAGVHIPSYLLDSPDGKTAPQFVTRVVTQFKEITGKDAKILRDRVSLEQLPPTPENLKRRVDYEDKLYQAMLPKLIKGELRTVSAKLKADLEVQNKKPDTANVSTEPRANGSSPTPTSWTLETSVTEARRLVDAELAAKGEFLDTAEKNLRVMTRARQLRQR
jgi:hypothetical protein